MEQGWGEPDVEDLPADEPMADVEVEGKGKGKAAVIPPEDSQAEIDSLMAQLDALEREKKDRHRQIMDQANVDISLVDVEIEERMEKLRKRLDRFL